MCYFDLCSRAATLLPRTEKLRVGVVASIQAELFQWSMIRSLSLRTPAPVLRVRPRTTIRKNASHLSPMAAGDPMAWGVDNRYPS